MGALGQWEGGGTLVGVDLDLDPQGESGIGGGAPVDFGMLADASADGVAELRSESRECLGQRCDTGR